LGWFSWFPATPAWISSLLIGFVFSCVTAFLDVLLHSQQLSALSETQTGHLGPTDPASPVVPPIEGDEAPEEHIAAHRSV
jgi:hypothetical protein